MRHLAKKDVSTRLPVWLISVGWWCGWLVFFWGMWSIVYPYRWYFPADFDASDFLAGRRATFRGTYAWAFYVHIVCGPIAIVLATILILSGGRKRYRKFHRIAGRILGVVVLLGLMPSGICMATQAYAGPIAGWGFASLAAATTVCTGIAIALAVKRRFESHRRWAIRSFILLCSPMLFRFASSALVGLEIESIWGYRLNAWLSWMLPLLIFELFRSRSNP